MYFMDVLRQFLLVKNTVQQPRNPIKEKRYHIYIYIYIHIKSNISLKIMKYIESYANFRV